MDFGNLPAPNQAADLVNKRYQLLAQIGAGSMGVVYRAFDRLTGTTVALKRLIAESDSARSEVFGNNDDLRLLMAREFKSLAALHHPNVISVQDYGFDAERKPYFTMELLHQADTILQAGTGQTDKGKVELLAQVLQALAYLHQHDIIHRDLKPSNVLVRAGQVKLLDFGLATIVGQGGGVSGTLAYLAPEVLEAAPAGRAADLYALGMIAYELFAGHHPFDTSNPSALIDAILDETPNFDLPSIPPPIAQVLKVLLTKEPEKRYSDARATIRAFSEAIQEPLPQETQETRESFLQAAQFVGREPELAKLEQALTEAVAGQGSAWLVGGESGVGKTRLVDEVRVQALVQGFVVLSGQAVSEGGNPYQLWQEFVRWLILLTDPDDLQTGVLKPLVPDIETLLGREVPNVPDLEPEAAQTRLLMVLIDLVQRCAVAQPTMIVLEDLQWARSNSLVVLRWFNRLVTRESLPLVILATFRTDETPDLARNYPEMNLIELGRLTTEAIATLSVSMLGSAGTRPQIIEFLQEQTEGNTFFIVEVMRALAEEAGQLDQIAQMPLPTQIFAGGMRQVVERRLSSLPETAKPLLHLAAVAGRELDLPLLTTAAPEQDIEQWLATCADAAVLQIQDQRWHFAHDKLRQGVLLGLGAEQRKELHRLIGAAIEQVYANQLAPHSADLAFHYHEAAEPELECRFARLAGEQAAIQFANDEAVAYLSRALALTAETDSVEQYDLLSALEKIYELRGQRDAQSQALSTLERLVKALDDDRKRSGRPLRWSNFAEVTGDYRAAISAAQAAIALARTAGDTPREARGHLYWGRALWRQGDFSSAQTQLERAWDLAGGDPVAEANSLRILGLVAWNGGDLGRARSYFEQALMICRQIGDRQIEGKVLNNLGIISAQQGVYLGAEDYFEQALHICRQIGDRQVEGNILNNLGIVSGYQGDYLSAGYYYEQALQIKEEIDDREGQSMVLDNLGDAFKYQGEYAQATHYFEQSLQIRQEIGERLGEGNTLNNLGSVADYQGDYASARAYFEQSLDIRREIGHRQGEAESLAYLSLLCHHEGHDDEALNYGEQAVQIANEVGDQHLLGNALTHMGHALVNQGHLAAAAEAYQQALTTRRALGEHNRALEPLAGLARVFLAQANILQALDLAEEILSHIAQQTVDGAEEPLRIYLTCYQVLKTSQDQRAQEVLDEACFLLEARVSKITDERMRRSFLENVAVHRELRALSAAVK